MSRFVLAVFRSGQLSTYCFYEFAAMPEEKDKGLNVPWHGADLSADQNHRLLDVCNGLCLSFGESLHRYCLSNATTNQCLLLPPQPPSRKRTTTKLFAALAFDPRESSHYRVVVFDDFVSNLGKQIVYIFSSKTGEWVRCIVQYKGELRPVDSRTYFKGAVYRLSETLHLLRYDLENLEKLQTGNVTAIELPGFGKPPCSVTKNELGCLGSSAGRLCYSTRTEESILIWMLPDGDCDCDCDFDFDFGGNGNGKWFVLHQISIPQLLSHTLRSHLVAAKLESKIHQFLTNDPSPVFNLLCFDPVSDAVILQSGDMLLRYGLETHDLGVVFDLAAEVPRVGAGTSSSQSIPPCEVFPFSRSLVPLKDIEHIESYCRRR